MNLHQILKQLWHLLLPPHCVLCNKPTHRDVDLCLPCEQLLPWHHHACYQCALPLPTNTHQKCGQCLTRPPAMDHTHSLFIFSEPINKMIHLMKFKNNLAIANLFGTLMAEHILKNYQRLPDLIIPMPLHPRRLRFRGYNQAELLTQVISKKTKIPMHRSIVFRKRYTPPQHTLSAKLRIKNMRNVFQIKENVEGKHILVIDDVITTGASVRALSQTINDAGARTIDVYSIARTIHEPHSILVQSR